jgi:hypothetical protein
VKLNNVVSVPPGVIWKTVPQDSHWLPPYSVVPYRSPLIACIRPPAGRAPSVHVPVLQNSYTVVNSPLRLILKTVPQPDKHRDCVIPPSNAVP